MAISLFVLFKKYDTPPSFSGLEGREAVSWGPQRLNQSPAVSHPSALGLMLQDLFRTAMAWPLELSGMTQEALSLSA